MERCEYTVFGDAINTSARLMVKAKGRISRHDVLCDEVTHRLCKDHAVFDEVPGITLKGKSAGTKVFGAEPILKKAPGSNPGGGPPSKSGARDGAAGPREAATFVGRESVVKQLLQRIGQVTKDEGPSDLVVVTGDVGMGKSRLLHHTLAKCRAGDDRVLVATVSADHSGNVLGPWKRLLKHLLRQVDGGVKLGKEEDDDDEEEDDLDGATSRERSNMLPLPERRPPVVTSKSIRFKDLPVEAESAGSGIGLPNATSSPGDVPPDERRERLDSNAQASTSHVMSSKSLGGVSSRLLRMSNPSDDLPGTGAGSRKLGTRKSLLFAGPSQRYMLTAQDLQQKDRMLTSTNGTAALGSNGGAALASTGSGMGPGPGTGGNSHTSFEQPSQPNSGLVSGPPSKGPSASKLLQHRSTRNLITVPPVDKESLYRSLTSIESQPGDKTMAAAAAAAAAAAMRESTPEEEQRQLFNVRHLQKSQSDFTRSTNTVLERPRAGTRTSTFTSNLLHRIHINKDEFYSWLSTTGHGSDKDAISSLNAGLPHNALYRESSGFPASLASPVSRGVGVSPPPAPRRDRRRSVDPHQTARTGTEGANGSRRGSLFRSETFGSYVRNRRNSNIQRSQQDKDSVPSPQGGEPSPTPSQPSQVPHKKERRFSLLGRQASRSNLAVARAPSMGGKQMAAAVQGATRSTGRRNSIQGQGGAQGRAQGDDREDFRVVVAVLRELLHVRGPIVLGIDEVDKMDSLSIELINHVLDVIPAGIIVVATISPLALKDSSRALSDLFRLHGPVMLEMGPLTKEETSQLIDAILGLESRAQAAGGGGAGAVVAGDAILHDYIYDRTHGHPLHTEQLLLLIKQSLDQDVSMEDLNYMLNKSISITSVILKRIDELRPGTQLTLKVASVLGNRIELSLLQRIHPLVLSESALQAQLSQLAQLNFLVRDGQDGIYRFSSELVREVCYGLIPVVQRGSVHQSIAFALQEALEVGLEVPASAIAYHLVRAPSRCA